MATTATTATTSSTTKKPAPAKKATATTATKKPAAARAAAAPTPAAAVTPAPIPTPPPAPAPALAPTAADHEAAYRDAKAQRDATRAMLAEVEARIAARERRLGYLDTRTRDAVDDLDSARADLDACQRAAREAAMLHTLRATSATAPAFAEQAEAARAAVTAAQTRLDQLESAAQREQAERAQQREALLLEQTQDEEMRAALLDEIDTLKGVLEREYQAIGEARAADLLSAIGAAMQQQSEAREAARAAEQRLREVRADMQKHLGAWPDLARRVRRTLPDTQTQVMDLLDLYDALLTHITSHDWADARPSGAYPGTERYQAGYLPKGLALSEDDLHALLFGPDQDGAHVLSRKQREYADTRREWERLQRIQAQTRAEMERQYRRYDEE